MTTSFQVGKLYKLQSHVILVLKVNKILYTDTHSLAVLTEEGLVYQNLLLTPSFWEELDCLSKPKP